MAKNATVLDGDGNEIAVEAPEVNKSAVDTAIRAVIPALKEHGESVGQSLADQMEAGLERIAKALEGNRPLNEEATSSRRSFANMQDNVAVGDDVYSKQEALEATGEYLHAFGLVRSSDKNAAKDALVKSSGRIGKLTEKLLTESEMGQLGILVPDTIRDTIKELRDDAVVVRRMAGPPVTIRGAMTLPKELSRAQAFYQGEAENLTITNFEMGQDRIQPSKLTCLVAASNELLKDGANISAVVNRQMRRAYALKEGDSLLQGDGTQHRPLGILNQLTQSANASGTTVQNIRNDAIAAEVAIRSKNYSTESAAWTFNSHRWGALMKKLANDSSVAPFAAEMMAGRFFGRPYFETNQLAEDAVNGSTMALVIRDFILIVDSADFEMDASRDASFIDDDGNLSSAFSKDLTVWRLIHRAGVHYEFPEAGFKITNAKYE